MSTKLSFVNSGKKVRKQETNKKKQQKSAMKDRQIKKIYLKSRNACKVTFKVFKEAVPDANQVCLVGDFNEWNILANPMKRLKKGDFTTD